MEPAPRPPSRASRARTATGAVGGLVAVLAGCAALVVSGIPWLLVTNQDPDPAGRAAGVVIGTFLGWLLLIGGFSLAIIGLLAGLVGTLGGRGATRLWAMFGGAIAAGGLALTVALADRIF